MRIFTFLLTVSAIAISTNASMIQKRKVSFTFEVCDGILERVGRNILNINDQVIFASSRNSPFDWNGIRGSGAVFLNAQSLCCKRFAPKMSSEDAIAIPTSLSSLADDYDSLVSTFANEKLIFEKDKDSIESATELLEIIHTQVNALFSCLISKPVANRTPAEIAVFDKLDKIYSNAKTVYDF